jgi:isopenicillin N synthase-like dioxygenase
MGLFYIKGHPISAARIDAVLDSASVSSLNLPPKSSRSTSPRPATIADGAIATEQLDPSKPSDLKETFDMGLHLPADHPEVLAEKPLRGPNRHPSVPGWEALMEQHYLTCRPSRKRCCGR